MVRVSWESSKALMPSEAMSVRAKGFAPATHTMPRKPKPSADPRRGEGAGGAAAQANVRGGGTSTDSKSQQTFLHANGVTVATPPANGHPTNQSFSPCPPTPNVHRGTKFDIADYVEPTTPSVALATAEQQEAFAEAVVYNEGILPACRACGMTPSAVFYHMGQHPEFQKMVYAAQAANFETQVYKLDELCNHLLSMPPKEMNQCANGYGRVFDYRMRIVGKLLPKMYGETPGAQVNIQNNTGIVCNEETRARLIELNQKILTAAQPKELDDVRD